MIKPHLLHLSGSGDDLGHAVVERDVERAAGKADTVPPPVGPASHVLVVHSGTSTNLTWSVDGRARRERFHRGQSLINPAGWASRPRWEEDVELMLVSMDPRWLERLAEEGGAKGVFELAPQYHLDDPLLAMMVERLVTEYELPGPADTLYTQALVQAVAAHVVKMSSARSDRLTRDGGLSPRRLALVSDYIEAHLHERLRLDDLARVAGLSESHFTRAFRTSTGQSPHQYVLRLRLDAARRALLSTDAPIAHIADATGFADQSHLTRMMRRRLGVTPSALRAARMSGSRR
ncbi:AraC family transcriptional regulator [Nocardiopsis mwathae]|uniref:AraC family transcriptional regulator n=1 Tax=Nocardiopsis mwathae TaxID=1472723 RepID=A0A7W9YJK9_9ACTN|nr:AraC family transcriptional regulator [Nocardiopsis mwathae]MBB6173364.1 AraC family transcriptional regulator [Nocardiopsis mwathae]